MSEGPDAFDDVWAESDEYDEITNGARPTADRQMRERAARRTQRRPAGSASEADRAKRAVRGGRASPERDPKIRRSASESARNQRSDTKPPVRAVAQLSELATAEIRRSRSADAQRVGSADGEPRRADDLAGAARCSSAVVARPCVLGRGAAVRSRAPSVDQRSAPRSRRRADGGAGSEPRRESSGRKKAKEKQRAVLEKAVKRGPMEERVHSKKPRRRNRPSRSTERVCRPGAPRRTRRTAS